MRIVTPSDASCARLEMGVGQADGAWFGYATIRDDTTDVVTLSVATLAEVGSALRGTADTASFDGEAGGSIAFRGAGYDVVTTVTTPGSVARDATYVRQGVAHMAEALVQRTTEG